ncbi:UPF0688 protein C1orf174 homolog [Trichomycterus rosablanca]|uniref:UPF0688 protein C1orf174 homolog n=1 Tax=Trichomycterus rosablanca TaxID=2290929 RepID=UPI002F350EAE
MAGDSGERKRLLKRPLPGYREDPAANNNIEPERGESGLGTCTHQHVRKEKKGKENTAVKLNESAHPNTEKMEDPESCGSTLRSDPGIVFDEDSNHVFPVEQFFGNLDTVQDCSQKVSDTEGMNRREYRRRHYYAKEDSDEDQT